MKRDGALLWLLAAAAVVGGACRSLEPEQTDPAEPGPSGPPGAGRAESPAASGTAEHGVPVLAAVSPGASDPLAMTSPCQPPDPATAAPPLDPAEIDKRPLTVEDTGLYNQDEGKPPADHVVEIDHDVDPATIEKQQDYLEAWKAFESSHTFASEAEREAARAALKRTILGV